MNEFLAALVIILFPGIVAAVICDKIAVHSRWGSFKFTLYAFVLGVSSYALVQVAQWAVYSLASLCPRWEIIGNQNLAVWAYVVDSSRELRPGELVVGSLVAIPVAFLAASAINHKWLNKIARRFGVSTKYGDENLFSYYLNADEIDWIYVRSISDGITYQGRIVSHSENENLQEMVLSEVSVYRYEDSAHLYDVPTLYLSGELGKFIIEAVPPERMEIR